MRFLDSLFTPLTHSRVRLVVPGLEIGVIFAILVICSIPWRVLFLHLLGENDRIFLLWCLKWTIISVLDPQGKSTLATVLSGLMGLL